MTTSPAGSPGRTGPGPAERPLGLVRGTRDWLPGEYARLARLERLLLERFQQAGYEPMRTPILEFAELHARKSGAGIVARLFELPGADTATACLRPELTASIVRAYAEAERAPLLPFRVSACGPVFRFQPPEAGRDREFTQIGVELIGTGGAAADAEVIWLADWSLRALGLQDATLRIGHVGLILELLGRSGLPPAASAAVVDSLSESASKGQSILAVESALERLAGWLRVDEAAATSTSASPIPDRGADRLFRHLVPEVTGRRSGQEIMNRLRDKWDLGHTLHEVLGRIRSQVHALADVRGPADAVLDRLQAEYADLAPDSVAALRDLVAMLGHHGVDPARIELDLGFGRGIGFYTQMIFELIVPTSEGPVEVCGGGRYDGLARVLGSDRDARGAGFALGLERLLAVLSARSCPELDRSGLTRGILLTGARPEAVAAETVDLATLLREWLRIPVVVAEHGFEVAVAQTRALGLSHLVVVGPGIELWSLEHGDVRSVREGELIEAMRARLSVFRGE